MEGRSSSAGRKSANQSRWIRLANSARTASRSSGGSQPAIWGKMSFHRAVSLSDHGSSEADRNGANTASSLARTDSTFGVVDTVTMGCANSSS